MSGQSKRDNKIYPATTSILISDHLGQGHRESHDLHMGPPCIAGGDVIWGSCCENSLAMPQKATQRIPQNPAKELSTGPQTDTHALVLKPALLIIFPRWGQLKWPLPS